MTTATKNPLKRYKDAGTLGLYHEYRIKDPETGGGSLLDHSGNGLHGSLVGTPTWDDGYTFAQGDAIEIDNTTALDTMFNGNNLTVIVILDELTSDNDDDTNPGEDYYDEACHIARYNDGPSGPVLAIHACYDSAATNDWRSLRCRVANMTPRINNDYNADYYYPLFDNGVRSYSFVLKNGEGPDVYAQKNSVESFAGSYSDSTATYPDVNPLYIGNWTRNPRTFGLLAGYKFPCIDKIQAVVIVQEALTADEAVEVIEYLLAFDSGDVRQHFGTQGGSRLEFVFHVLGYPYGLSTSHELNDAIDVNLNIKRKLYGLAEDANSVYLADDTPTFDLLERPGKMGMAIDFDKAKLTGGNWKAHISNQQIGYSWPHRTSDSDAANTTIQVLDGLATIPSVQNDSSIHWATIAEDVKKADTSFDITEEDNELLIDKIDTRNTAGKTTVLFFGQETIAVDDVTDNGDGTYTLTGVTRGAYKSMIQSHLIEEFDGKSERVADAPLGGAPGRWYELYAIPICDKTGAILDEPFLMRFGQIQSDISISRERISVGCGSINTAIEKSTNIINATGHLAKYTLSRPNIGTTADRNQKNKAPAPHIMISEDGDKTNIQSIWLCDQNDSVTFDTLGDLIKAIQIELNYCSAGSASQQSGDGTSGNALIDLDYHYVVTKTGIYAVDSIVSATVGPTIGGVLPWLLSLFSAGLGDLSSEQRYGPFDNISNGPPVGRMMELNKWARWIAGEPDFNTNELWCGNGATSHMMPCRIVPWHEIGDTNYEFMVEDPGIGGDMDQRYRARYIVQPDLDSVTDPTTGVVELSSYMERRNSWPVPSTLYVEPGFDASKYANEICILGDEAGSQIYGTVNVTTVTPGDYDALTCTNGNGHQFELKKSLPAMLYYDKKNAGESSNTGISSKCPLYWLPGTQNIPDPWTIRPVGCFEDEYFSTLLIGVAGFGSIDVPEKYQVQVPWLYDDTRGDFSEAIDWTQLDLIHDPISPGHNYKLRLGREQFNWGETFWKELAFHGIQPVYAPDFLDRTWKIRFRFVGPANKTKATWEGRSFGSGSMISDSGDSFSLIEARRFSKVRVSLDYDDSEEKYRSNLNLELRSQIKTGKDSKLVLESKLSHLDQTGTTANKDFFKSMMSHVARILRHLSSTSATYDGQATMDKLWGCQLGNEISITDETMWDPSVGSFGITDKAALVSNVSTNFARQNQEIQFGYSITEDSEFAIAPAMRVQANNSSKDASKVTITPDTNYFSQDNTVDRVDMSWFDCLDYDPSETTDPEDASNYQARDCSCSYYRVIAFERDDPDATILSFTARNIDIDAGTCELWGTTTNWDTAEEYIVLYAPWNTAGLADCQMKFLAFADPDSLLVDSSANETKGHKVI